MATIKINSLERLAELIQCEIKALKDSVCAGPSPRGHQLKYPSLAINPLRFRFFPYQADYINPLTGAFYDAPAGQSVVNVGRWQGEIELRLGAKSAIQRYKLEEQVEALFLKGLVYSNNPDPYAGECLRPGILLIDVPECYGARVAFELQEDTWNNEKVFTNEWYSVLRVNAQIPALVAKSYVPSLKTICLQLTEDLETVVTSPLGVPAGTELVTINEDGTIT